MSKHDKLIKRSNLSLHFDEGLRTNVRNIANAEFNFSKKYKKQSKNNFFYLRKDEDDGIETEHKVYEKIDNFIDTYNALANRIVETESIKINRERKSKMRDKHDFQKEFEQSEFYSTIDEALTIANKSTADFNVEAYIEIINLCHKEDLSESEWNEIMKHKNLNIYKLILQRPEGTVPHRITDTILMNTKSADILRELLKRNDIDKSSLEHCVFGIDKRYIENQLLITARQFTEEAPVSQNTLKYIFANSITNSSQKALKFINDEKYVLKEFEKTMPIDNEAVLSVVNNMSISPAKKETLITEYGCDFSQIEEPNKEMCKTILPTMLSLLSPEFNESKYSLTRTIAEQCLEKLISQKVLSEAQIEEIYKAYIINKDEMDEDGDFRGVLYAMVNNEQTPTDVLDNLYNDFVGEDNLLIKMAICNPRISSSCVEEQLQYFLNNGMIDQFAITIRSVKLAYSQYLDIGAHSKERLPFPFAKNLLLSANCPTEIAKRVANMPTSHFAIDAKPHTENDLEQELENLRSLVQLKESLQGTPSLKECSEKIMIKMNKVEEIYDCENYDSINPAARDRLYKQHRTELFDEDMNVLVENFDRVFYELVATMNNTQGKVKDEYTFLIKSLCEYERIHNAREWLRYDKEEKSVHLIYNQAKNTDNMETSAAKLPEEMLMALREEAKEKIEQVCKISKINEIQKEDIDSIKDFVMASTYLVTIDNILNAKIRERKIVMNDISTNELNMPSPDSGKMQTNNKETAKNHDEAER